MVAKQLGRRAVVGWCWLTGFVRVEFVKAHLEGAAPKLAKRIIANGVGSQQTMVGTDRDDASDALDRRVEFKVIGG